MVRDAEFPAGRARSRRHRLARRRREFRIVWLFLERRAGDERLRQVFRILDDGGDGEPLDRRSPRACCSTRSRRPRRCRARRSSAGIRAACRVVTTLSTPGPVAGAPPNPRPRLCGCLNQLADRRPLPGRLGRTTPRPDRSEETRLRSRVRLDLERHIVCPGDARARRHPHDPAGAERPALLTARVVRGEIPGVGDATAFGVQRDAGVIALGRRHHSPAPVLADDRDPRSRSDRTAHRRAPRRPAAHRPLTLRRRPPCPRRQRLRRRSRHAAISGHGVDQQRFSSRFGSGRLAPRRR